MTNNKLVLLISKLEGRMLYAANIVNALLILSTIFVFYGILNNNNTNLHINVFLGYGLLYYLLYMFIFQKSGRKIEVYEDKIIWESESISKGDIHEINILLREYFGQIKRVGFHPFMYNGSNNEISISKKNNELLKTNFYIGSRKELINLVNKLTDLQGTYIINIEESP